MLVIGLTGGIGSGKSAVSDLFAKLYNVPVIDADIIAKQLVEKPDVLEQLQTHIGQEYFEQNRLLRKKLRQAVFSNDELRSKLEGFLHPLVYAEIQRQLEILNPETNNKESTANYCMVVIPLLLETERTEFIDRILVVDCTIEEQIRRTSQRDHCDKEHVEAIIHSQIERQKRLELADDIIENHGTIESLKEKVELLDTKYNLINQQTLS